MRIDIICSVLNGERFLPEFLDSLAQQTHRDWRLWLRDDGSDDRTVEIFQAAAAADDRIHILHVGGPRLGVARTFGWVLERVPRHAAHIMAADADDVWLPEKIEHTLAAMLRAESEWGSATPILVHTDLVVVDERLREIHPSFWEYTALEPERDTLRRLVLRNPATGPTIMLNAALRERIGETPAEARHHDWWYAIVAAAVGKIVALPEATVLYRQHGANDVGAKRPGSTRLTALPGAALDAFARREELRAWIARTAAQARVVLERFGSELSEDDRAFLRDYIAIPDKPSLIRKLDLLRLNALPGTTRVRRLGALLRA